MSCDVREQFKAFTERMSAMRKPLSPEHVQKMNAYWRAANYLSVGQIYLYDNPLLQASR